MNVKNHCHQLALTSLLERSVLTFTSLSIRNQIIGTATILLIVVDFVLIDRIPKFPRTVVSADRGVPNH